MTKDSGFVQSLDTTTPLSIEISRVRSDAPPFALPETGAGPTRAPENPVVVRVFEWTGEHTRKQWNLEVRVDGDRLLQELQKALAASVQGAK